MVSGIVGDYDGHVGARATEGSNSPASKSMHRARGLKLCEVPPRLRTSSL